MASIAGFLTRVYSTAFPAIYSTLAHMAANTHILPAQKVERLGLAHFMRRALKQCERTAQDFDADSVHDLRVALRRSRTIADGLASVMPDKQLRALKKASKNLFGALGVLRDIQVMEEWVRKLSPEDDAIKTKLCAELAGQEAQAKTEAARELAEFDTRRWRRWARALADKSRVIPVGGQVFQHLAMQRWIEANEAHRRATRSRSRVAWHRVRIAVKRFRYTVENFLPRQYAEWADDLKSAQDWLGEVHDLDVLRTAMHRFAGNVDANLLETCIARIDAARAERLAAYRAKAKGRNSLWKVWRAGLPDGERLERAAMATLSAWASFEDPDFDHARHVSKLALNMWDAFHDAGIHRIFREPRARRILEAAALLHDVGRAKKDSGHHKISCKMIQKHAPPLGWTSDEMLWTALVARYHRGSEPRADQNGFSTLLPDERENVSWLAAVLRLADALDANHKGRITGVAVESVHPAVMLRADGYVHDVESAGIIARKKHLLETLCGSAVIVQPAEAAPASMATTVTSLAS